MCSTYIGWGISNYYKKRIAFFQNLDDFIHYAMRNINFFKDSVEQIITQYIVDSTLSNDFKDVLVKYKAKKELGNILILKRNEVNLIKNIFAFLGKNDSENQIAGLKNFSSQSVVLIDNAKEEYKKVGSICTKLGFLLGLVIAICLI